MKNLDSLLNPMTNEEEEDLFGERTCEEDNPFQQKKEQANFIDQTQSKEKKRKINQQIESNGIKNPPFTIPIKKFSIRA